MTRAIGLTSAIVSVVSTTAIVNVIVPDLSAMGNVPVIESKRFGVVHLRTSFTVSIVNGRSGAMRLWFACVVIPEEFEGTPYFNGEVGYREACQTGKGKMMIQRQQDMGGTYSS